MGGEWTYLVFEQLKQCEELEFGADVNGDVRRIEFKSESDLML